MAPRRISGPSGDAPRPMGEVRVSETVRPDESFDKPEAIIGLADDALNRAFQVLQDEDQMKLAIRSALNGVRGAIDSACESFPASEEGQRRLARSCVDGAHAAANGDFAAGGYRIGVAGAGADGFEERKQQMVFDADDFDASNPEAVLVGRQLQPTPADLGRLEEEFGVAVGNLTEDDVAKTISVVRTVLLDLQEQLLDLSDEDVDELAEVSLVVARMALFYAKGVNDTLAANFGVDLEERASQRHAAQQQQQQQQQQQGDENAELSAAAAMESRRRTLLWAPLGPKLWNKAKELAASGQQRPAAAVAVVACMLPFAWIPLMFATPLVLGDYALRWAGKTMPGSVVAAATSDAMQVARLWYLVAKISTRQSYRFAKREFNRVGGVRGVARCSLGAVATVAADPIGTAKVGYRGAAAAGSAAWERLVWLKQVARMSRNPYEQATFDG